MSTPNCPAGGTPDAEDLADTLDREHRAHEQTRQALVQAARELEHLRSVETGARAVLSVCDAVTPIEQQPERLRQLDFALCALRAVLGGELAVPTLETIANLIMLTSLRAGAQGRDFDAYEAATLVEAWLRGDQGQPRSALSLENDLRHQVWLQQWRDAGAAAREAEAVKALTEAGVPAGVPTRPGVVSHFPADRIRWLAARHLELLEQVDEWKAASGLEVGGDPGGVEPEHLHRRWAELYSAAAPFLQLARDRLARRSWEPLPDAACHRFLAAFDDEGPLAPAAPPEAFTATHALEPDMPGLPGGVDVDND